MFYGDRNPGDRIDWDISFVNTSGVPTALSSGSAFCRQLPTLSIAPAGVVLTASGGLNMVTIFTASASSFYAAGFDYSVITATGNISGNGVQDLVLGQFSLQNRNFLRPTTAGRTLDVSSGGEAGVDWANVGSPTTAVNLSATNIDTDQVVASVSGAVGSVTGAVGSVTGSVGSVVATVSADVIQWRNTTPNVLISGRVDANAAAVTVSAAVLTMATGSIAAATFAAGAIDAAALAASAGTELADAMFARSLGAESYAADGAVPTFAEMQFMLWSVFAQFAITTTTISTKKLDGTTEAMTFGMDATADTATSRTRLT